MIDLLQLGIKIGERRRHLQLSQVDLARKARISRATLDAVENQRTGEIGFTKLVRILAALGLELKLQEATSSRPTLDDLMEEDRNDQSLSRRG